MTSEELEAIEERSTKATPGPNLVRYSLGGGRSLLDNGRERKLVADYYHEEDREFYHNALTDIPRLLDHIKFLESRIPRWIPVSEKVPEANSRVLICTNSGWEDVGYVSFHEDSISFYKDMHCKVRIYGITHWMTLPEGPEPGA